MKTVTLVQYTNDNRPARCRHKNHYIMSYLHVCCAIHTFDDKQIHTSLMIRKLIQLAHLNAAQKLVMISHIVLKALHVLSQKLSFFILSLNYCMPSNLDLFSFLMDSQGCLLIFYYFLNA